MVCPFFYRSTAGLEKRPSLHSGAGSHRPLGSSDDFEESGHRLGACHSHWCSPRTVNTIYKTINKTYLCALDNSLPEHQGCCGGHHWSPSANQNISLAVDQGHGAPGRVCVPALVHQAPFSMFVLKVRIPSPSPSISWQAVHLQGFSWGTFEILIIKKEVLFSESKEGEDILWDAQCGTPECSAAALHGVPSIQKEKY